MIFSLVIFKQYYWHMIQKMKSKLIFLLVILGACQIENLKALECGLKNDPSEKLRDALSQCLKGEETLDKLLETAKSSNDQQGEENVQNDDSSAESEEKDQPQQSSEASQSRNSNRNQDRANNNNSKSSNTNNWNSKFNAGGYVRSRFRRAVNLMGRHRMLPGINRDELIKITGRTYPTLASTTNRSTTSTAATTEENDDSSVESDDNNVQADGENSDELCAVQCVFDKLEMTDSNGLPDRKKLIDGLVQSANSRELRNFLQKSTEECFQQIEQDDSQDSCNFSIKIASCLAEKGRQDCSDWPAEPLPL